MIQLLLLAVLCNSFSALLHLTSHKKNLNEKKIELQHLFPLSIVNCGDGWHFLWIKCCRTFMWQTNGSQWVRRVFSVNYKGIINFHSLAMPVKPPLRLVLFWDGMAGQKIEIKPLSLCTSNSSPGLPLKKLIFFFREHSCNIIIIIKEHPSRFLLRVSPGGYL